MRTGHPTPEGFGGPHDGVSTSWSGHGVPIKGLVKSCDNSHDKILHFRTDIKSTILSLLCSSMP